MSDEKIIKEVKKELSRIKNEIFEIKKQSWEKAREIIWPGWDELNKKTKEPYNDFKKLIELMPSLQVMFKAGYNFHDYLKAYCIDAFDWTEMNFKEKTVKNIIDAIIKNERIKGMPSKGGKADKTPKAILEFLKNKIIEHPAYSAKQLLDLFPPSYSCEIIQIDNIEYGIYFDETGKIIQENHTHSTKPRSLGFDRFQKYVTEIKQELGIKKKNSKKN